MATTYKLESRILGSGTWIPATGDMTLADGEVRQSLSGLTTDSDYEFRIVRNANGVLAVSNVLSARTKIPDSVGNGGTIAGLGTFSLTGESATVTRSATSTIINFSNASWDAVGITFNPGAGQLKYFIPNRSATMDGFTLDSSNLYLLKSGQRAVVVKLAASVGFTLELPGSPNNFTASIIAV